MNRLPKSLRTSLIRATVALVWLVLVTVPTTWVSGMVLQQTDKVDTTANQPANTWASRIAKEGTRNVSEGQDLANALGSNDAFAPRLHESTVADADNSGTRVARRATPKNSSSSAKATPTTINNKQIGTTDWVLAEQPEFGARHNHRPPKTDVSAHSIPPSAEDFGPTPVDPTMPYDASSQIWVYAGKTLNANRRPLVELGKPWYQLGELRPGETWLGRHNLVLPQFLVYGDFRTGYGAHDFGTDNTSRIAWELNLNFDFRLTATERFVMFIAPLDKDNRNTRWLLDEDLFVEELDAEVDFGFFEGDMGALAGGAVGQTLPFDLPFALGVMPMVIQNGVWMEDAILGLAATIPARSSARLDISNLDFTFFAAYDNIDSPAFEGDNNAAKMYGFATFIDALGGYIELDYAFLEDRNRDRNRSYHNIGAAYTRRFGRFISHSTRVIINAGQSTRNGPQTADGTLLLFENSLITSHPQTFVPYFNFWAGFDLPQSAARAAAAGGVLRNTGILFETDGLTAYPTLDATANDTWGGALGMNILTPGFTQQLILEMAFLQTMGSNPNRNAAGNQYGLGARYQLPLSNSWILRSDAMYGFLNNAPDVHGFLLELRHKF